MSVNHQVLSELGRRVRGSNKLIRGRCVLLDVDLAGVYGVSVTNLRRQVARHADRFPADLAFRLSPSEVRCLKKVGLRAVWAFRDEGALMLASILKGPIAAEVSVRFVRALLAGQTGQAFEFMRRAVEKAD